MDVADSLGYKFMAIIAGDAAGDVIHAQVAAVRQDMSRANLLNIPIPLMFDPQSQIGSYPATVTDTKPSAVLYCRKPSSASATLKLVGLWFMKTSSRVEALLTKNRRACLFSGA